jgi:hypothetical protein
VAVGLLLGGAAINTVGLRKDINDFEWTWLLSRMLLNGDRAYDPASAQAASVSLLDRDLTAGRRLVPAYFPATGVVLAPFGLMPFKLASPLFVTASFILLLLSMWTLMAAFPPGLALEYRCLTVGLVSCMACTRWAFTSKQVGPLLVFATVAFLVALTEQRAARTVLWGVVGISLKVTLALPFVGVLLALRRFRWALAMLGLFLLLNTWGYQRMGGVVAAASQHLAVQARVGDLRFSIDAPDPRVPDALPRVDLEFLLNAVLPFGQLALIVSRLITAALAALTLLLLFRDRETPRRPSIGLRLYTAFFTALGLFVVYHHHYDTIVLLVPAAILLPIRFSGWAEVGRRLFLVASLLYPGLFFISAITWARAVGGELAAVFVKELGAISVLTALLAAIGMLWLHVRPTAASGPSSKGPPDPAAA